MIHYYFYLTFRVIFCFPFSSENFALVDLTVDNDVVFLFRRLWCRNSHFGAGLLRHGYVGLRLGFGSGRFLRLPTSGWYNWRRRDQAIFRGAHWVFFFQRRLSDPSANINNFVRGGWKTKPADSAGAKSRSENEGLDSLANGLNEIEAGDIRDGKPRKAICMVEINGISVFLKICVGSTIETWINIKIIAKNFLKKKLCQAVNNLHNNDLSFVVFYLMEDSN